MYQGLIPTSEKLNNITRHPTRHLDNNNNNNNNDDDDDDDDDNDNNYYLLCIVNPLTSEIIWH